MRHIMMLMETPTSIGLRHRFGDWGTGVVKMGKHGKNGVVFLGKHLDLK